MTTRVVSTDREGAELAEQAIEGLERLEVAMRNAANFAMAQRCRTYIAQLKRTPIASLELAFGIADCLEIWAQLWAYIDRPEVAEVLRWRAQRIRERALERAGQPA